uniref:Uncharacterized protein n=1 Tax=Myripristis murdjan TaxID=586833 RepID=A0A668ACP6_9TELE
MGKKHEKDHRERRLLSWPDRCATGADPCPCHFYKTTSFQVDVNPHGGSHSPVGVWDRKGRLSTGCQDCFDTTFVCAGGIAACGNVHSCDEADTVTTGRDYSSDVAARAEIYVRVRQAVSGKHTQVLVNKDIGL